MKKILFVASEANPYAGTGGLGDVMGSLPAAIAQADPDADVRVVIPLYSTVKSEYREKMERVDEFVINLSWRRQYCGVYALKEKGVTYYFIDNEFYFKRNALYGNYDDGERYAYFCKAVMDMVTRIDFVPDILHANDWQSALCVIYQKHKYRFPNTKTVYTIHNIDYQGIYGTDILSDVFELGQEAKDDLTYNGCLNLTKGAMICANHVTTVSQQYSEEIKGEYFASGLHHAVRSCSHKLSGIVNGIDYSLFDPTNSPEIASAFSCEDLSGKAECKAEVQRLFGLPVTGRVDRATWNKLREIYLEIVASIPPSIYGDRAKLYPGYVLSEGMRGSDVSDLQTYLSFIADFYNDIPKLPVTGYFGTQTREVVETFQRLFGLPVTGTVGAATWYQISEQYNFLKETET